MKKRRSTKLIHEGRYVAEVDIDLLDSKDGLVTLFFAGRCVENR